MACLTLIHTGATAMSELGHEPQGSRRANVVRSSPNTCRDSGRHQTALKGQLQTNHRSNVYFDSIASLKAHSVGGMAKASVPRFHYRGETKGSDGKALRALKRGHCQR